MANDSHRGEYILGHSDNELARLERQALFFAEQTEDVLRRAGLKPGLDVLDVGCGVGDVSLAAAKMVAPDGSVTGMDQSTEALAMAERRAVANGVGNVRFEAADLKGYVPGRQFDAIVGRFILLHMPDPAAALRALLPHLRPGGTVAFIEMDIGEATAVPRLPLFEQCLRFITEVYKRVGLEPDMGSRLFAAFRAVGLKPRLTGSVRIEGPWDSLPYDYFVESLRILAPVIEKTGIASASEIGLDTLADRLRTQAIAGEHYFYFPRVIGAWANI
jgi:SAM-dependent methyltransferase